MKRRQNGQRCAQAKRPRCESWCGGAAHGRALTYDEIETFDEEDIVDDSDEDEEFDDLDPDDDEDDLDDVP